MYDNDNYFTKEPYEDNGRCKIHPLSEEGKEAYLSKDSYNYNFIKTKKNPDLIKQIEDEIRKENELKNKKENNDQKPNDNTLNQQEDKKEENCEQTKTTKPNPKNKSKNKKGKNANLNKNNNAYYMSSKGSKNIINKGGSKKNENKRKQSPGLKLAKTIERIGKVAPPVISNVNNDRGRLRDYPLPYQG